MSARGPRTRPDAFATRTASAATADASSSVILWLAANPQKPSTITRTPNPSDSSAVSDSTFLLRTVMFSDLKRTMRTSA